MYALANPKSVSLNVGSVRLGRDSQAREPSGPIIELNQNVLWLDVQVHYVVPMEILNGTSDMFHHSSAYVHWKNTDEVHYVKQITMTVALE